MPRLLAPPPEPLWPSIFLVYFFAAIWTIGEIYTSFHAQREIPYLIGLYATYFGLFMVIPTWWIFSYAFAEHVGLPFRNQNKWIRYGPYGIAAIFWILLITNPIHEQFLVPKIGGRNEYKIIWYVGASYSYIMLLAISMRLILLRIRAHRSAVSGQVNILLAATLVPGISNFLFTSGFINVNFDLTISAFTISGVLFSIGIYRDRLFAMSPVALQHVIRN